MVGQMTLVYIILRHNQQQAQCYQINVNLKTQRGRGGVPSTPSFCITVGCWGTSYLYNLNVEMNSHDSQILQHWMVR